MFRWCFIGTGALAHQVAREICRSGRHAVTAVYSRRFEKAEEFAAVYGGTAYEDVAAAISAEDVDGVYVVTPHSSHYEYVKLAIELGVPVLCEKPFTTDVKKARELFTLAKERNVYVAEAMWTWFSPVARQVKHWVDSGEFGEMQEVFISYHVPIGRNRGRLTDPNAAGGALLDIGIYPVTYIYRLFGRPQAILCRGDVRDGVDHKEEIYMKYPGGKVWRATVSMDDFYGTEYLQLRGDKAKLRQKWFHFAKQAKLVRTSGGNEVFRGDGGYLNEFDLVASEIREGRNFSAYVPPQATLDVLVLLDECRRQMGLVYPFEEEL